MYGLAHRPEQRRDAAHARGRASAARHRPSTHHGLRRFGGLFSPTMSGDHWERVQLLFDELIELDTGHRHARLELLSRTDPRLSDELRSLVDAHERAGDFLGLLGAPP